MWNTASSRPAFRFLGNIRALAKALNALMRDQRAVPEDLKTMNPAGSTSERKQRRSVDHLVDDELFRSSTVNGRCHTLRVAEAGAGNIQGPGGSLGPAGAAVLRGWDQLGLRGMSGKRLWLGLFHQDPHRHCHPSSSAVLFQGRRPAVNSTIGACAIRCW